MFNKVSLDQPWPLIEEQILEYWENEEVFKKLVAASEGKPSFVFYEGPPTANGKPGIHHVLARIYKDLFCRYKSMQGFHVPRKAGWDTHGLPVELEVEKRLKISGKKEIEAYGVAEFIAECKKSIFTYKEDWDRNTKRIGYWLDLENPYITCSNTYIESIWWALKVIYEKGLVYKGHKVVPHCPRCQTTLSSHEVAQGYDDHTVDPSIFVKFPLAEKNNEYFLVWTTTPWTLTANVALAIQKRATYVKVNYNDEVLILAKERLSAIFKTDEVSILKEYSGEELINQRYQMIYPYGGEELNRQGCRVVAADFVGLQDGTGIVHIAPAYGADDMTTGIDHDLPVLITIDTNGLFKDWVTEYKGLFVKDADKLIIRNLKDRNLLFRSETIVHTYPFCWRCSSPLLYLAKDSWFIRTSAIKDNLLELNETVKWYPSHIKKGRFGEWLKDAKDWAISRERFWGTPLNIWECSSCTHKVVIGSVSELEELSGQDCRDLDLHRPFIDDISLACPECRQVMYRVKEVLDCWLDSGSMPFAQHHYPFECDDLPKQHYPADFISEGIDQTRGWFFTLLVMNGILFEKAPYRSVLTFELVLDEKGEKMSKSRGNVVDVVETIQNYGADAIRWSMFFSSTPYVPRRFSTGLVSDAYKNFILPLLHMSSFFVTYANIDAWIPESYEPALPQSSSLMDRWILSRLEKLIDQLVKSMDNVDVTDAAKRIAVFVEDLTNWYIRRSRRRFWKSESDEDKDYAYKTLYYVLTRLSIIIAPFVPFLSEYLHQIFSSPLTQESRKSIHWKRYPVVEPDAIDPLLDQAMEHTREWITAGLRARKKAGIKVRFPLASMRIISKDTKQMDAEFIQIIREELNIQEIIFEDNFSSYAQLIIKPNLPVLGKKAGKQLPLIKEALQKLSNPLAWYNDLEANRKASLILGDGTCIEVEKEDLIIETQALGSKWQVEAALMDHIVLETTLSRELLLEGFSREIIHAVQMMRKEAGFEVSDLIEIQYSTDCAALTHAIEQHGNYIQTETLARAITFSSAMKDAKMVSFEAPEGTSGEIAFIINRSSF
jgi:isoleucyl-tRNA synthetase